MIYHQTEIILIHGMPINGKTSTADLIANKFKNSIVINSDVFFVTDETSNVYNKYEYNIYDICNSSEFSYIKHLIIFKIFKTFQEALTNNFLPFVIIEGYSVGKCLTELCEYFKDFKIHIMEMKNFEVFYNNETISRETMLEKIATQNPEKDSLYQTFDFLNFDKKDSDSLTKLKMSKLLDYDYTDKKVLDVGCNAGYFLFKILQQCENVQELVGVDTNDKWLNVCYNINRNIFMSNKIKLYHQSWSDLIEKDFDLIFCFSTFHYFINQKEFIENAFTKLNESGILVLEVELSPMTTSIVEKLSRDGNGFLDYPSQSKIEEWVTNMFQIIKIEKSVFQGGQFYDRYFFHLKKISHTH